MKNLFLLMSLILCGLISCSEEEPDISGNYKLTALMTSCDNPDQNLDLLEGDNQVLGTNVNFSGTMLFTVGGAFKVNYVLAAPFSSQETFIEGTYSISDKNFRVCGNNGCTDNSVPSGLNQVTMQFQEGECLLTITGERE